MYMNLLTNHKTRKIIWQFRLLFFFVTIKMYGNLFDEVEIYDMKSNNEETVLTIDDIDAF